MKPGRRVGRSLRLQVLATFAVGSVLVVGLVSLVTYGVSRSYLLRQRRAYVTRQATVDARLIDDLSRAQPDSVPQLLGSLETPANSVPFLYRGGRWFSPRAGQDEQLIPAAVRDAVLNRRREKDLHFEAGGPKLVVGIPLGTGDGYFEVFPLHELAHTLSAVRLALVVAALATLLGSLALGRFVLGRLLDPVVDIGRTARAIADGERTRRLDGGRYEELAELAATFNEMVEALNTQIERDAQRMEDRGTEILRTHRLVFHVGAVFVGFAIDSAAADAASGDDRGIARRPVLAAGIGSAVLVDVRRAAEFSSDDHQRVVQHAAIVQISQQRGERLIETGQAPAHAIRTVAEGVAHAHLAAVHVPA